MWQLKHVFTRATTSIPWYHESSEEAAAATVVMDNMTDSLINQEMGESIERTYGDTEARFTITLPDPERALDLVYALESNIELREQFTTMLKYGISMGNTAHTNDPNYPELGEYIDMNIGIE